MNLRTPGSSARPSLGHRSRAVGVLLVVVSLASACAGGGSDKPAAGASQAAGNVDASQGRFFAASSPWNTRIDSATIDPRSDEMMTLARERIGVQERAGGLAPTIQRRVDTSGLYINTKAWTTPIVTGGVVTKLVCRQSDCGDDIPGGELEVPVDISPDPRYDGWFTVISAGTGYAYDLWRARRESDDTITYNFARRWALDGPGYSAPQTVGARGSGLPLFAGLIRLDELTAGRIDHALAISVPGPAQRVFVPPASATDGNGRDGSVPEGARLRLKDNVTLRAAVDPRTGDAIKLTAAQRRTADAIVAALRIYGAIVVDRAAVPTLYAQRDVTSAKLAGNEIQGLTLEDFDVMKLPAKITYPADTTGEASR